MDDRQERLVGQRRPLRHAEDAIVLVGPRQHVLPACRAATSRSARLPGAVQVLAALAQRVLGLLALGDVPECAV